MEERNIKISLTEAREWYNSENETLKALAIQAFSEKELETTLPRTWEEWAEQNPQCSTEFYIDSFSCIDSMMPENKRSATDSNLLETTVEFLECKRYKFLCHNDDIKVGSLIKDVRYSTNMQVVEITNCSRGYQDNMIIKDVKIDSFSNDFVDKYIGNLTINPSEKTITITEELAREWYHSGNTALKTIALSIYPESSLQLNYKYALKSINTTTIESLPVPTEEVPKIVTNAKLAVIAKYYNGNWKKTSNNTGYFITKLDSNSILFKKERILSNGFCILKHDTVEYPGIVYFKEVNSAEKAFNALKDEIIACF